MTKKLAYIIATGFGSGCLPKAPGTWGSLVGMLLLFLVLPFGTAVLAFLTLLITLVGLWSSVKVMEDLEDPDPSFIVIDEIAGIFLTFLLIAHFDEPITFYHLVLGFCTFRLFDIWKPFPISWADEYFAHNENYQAVGVMLDDLLAAIPAAIITLAVVSFI